MESFLEYLSLYWCTYLLIILGIISVFTSKRNRFFNVLGKMGWFFLAFVCVCINYWVVNDMSFLEKRLEKSILQQDYQKAHRTLDRIRNKGKVYEEEFYTSQLRLLDAEINEFMKGNKAYDVSCILETISDISLISTPIIGIIANKTDMKTNERYIRFVTAYNDELNKIFKDAVVALNIEFAEEIAKLYKPNLTKTLVEKHIFGCDEYNYAYTNSAYDDAMAKIQEPAKHKRDISNTADKQEKQQIIQKVIYVQSQSTTKTISSPQTNSNHEESSVSLQEDKSNLQKEQNNIVSNVDVDIPEYKKKKQNDNTFAVIFANENYKYVSKVQYALNDGEIFAQYCNKTLGIPTENIHLVKNATYIEMMNEIDWLEKISNTYEEAKLIVYYAGHGIPDDKSKSAYLIPIDGKISNIKSNVKLYDMLHRIGQFSFKCISVFIDACFSGVQREGKMLTSKRGVAIKATPTEISGNMVVFTAAQSDETAGQYTQMNHGIFTYHLLKILNETEGNASLKDIVNNVTINVQKTAILKNDETQTPSFCSSKTIGNKWQHWKLNN